VTGLGERLRAARERAGLSIADISARTKISVTILQALERDDYARLPGDFYTRAFLKAYAREVNLPSDDLLQEYDAAHLPPQPIREAVVVAPPAPAPRVAAQPLVLLWPRQYNGVIGVVLAAVLLLALVSFRDSDEKPRAAPGVVSTAGASDAAPKPAATSGRAAAPEKLVIAIRPTAPIWVSATADGNNAIYRLLKPGEQVMVEAQKELSFRIGNAAAFTYAINGVPGKPLGGPDEVREFEITRDNFQTYHR
jgi:transcriptional regulator with XRE-family HTH domain